MIEFLLRGNKIKTILLPLLLNKWFGCGVPYNPYIDRRIDVDEFCFFEPILSVQGTFRMFLKLVFLFHVKSWENGLKPSNTSTITEVWIRKDKAFNRRFLNIINMNTGRQNHFICPSSKFPLYDNFSDGIDKQYFIVDSVSTYFWFNQSKWNSRTIVLDGGKIISKYDDLRWE